MKTMNFIRPHIRRDATRHVSTNTTASGDAAKSVI
jgi:hypothetical protein